MTASAARSSSSSPAASSPCLLIVGLVVDGGTAFVNRRGGQNTADLAALAGTKKLADTWRQAGNPGVYVGGNAYQAIATSVAANDCADASICTWTARYVGQHNGATFPDLGPVGAGDTAIPGWNGGTPALGIKVDVTRTPRTYFLGVIGQSTWNVGTTGTAIAGRSPNAPAGQLLPIGFVDPGGGEPNLQTIFALTSGANGPGNFGWLSWTGSNSAGDLATSLCTPNNPPFTLPAQFPGDPGKTNASEVRACLEQWVDNGETVLIPIVYAANDPAAPAGCRTGQNGNNFTFCIKATRRVQDHRLLAAGGRPDQRDVPGHHPLLGGRRRSGLASRCRPARPTRPTTSGSRSSARSPRRCC